MIRQDYIIRMIQEIISAIAEALLKRKKLEVRDRHEYDCIAKQILGMDFNELSTIDCKEIIEEYSNKDDGIDKIELIAVSLLLISEEKTKDFLLKSRLKQNGIELLKYVRENSNDFSIQRETLIKMMDMDNL